jgi:hypothetical protein
MKLGRLENNKKTKEKKKKKKKKNLTINVERDTRMGQTMGTVKIALGGPVMFFFSLATAVANVALSCSCSAISSIAALLSMTKANNNKNQKTPQSDFALFWLRCCLVCDCVLFENAKLVL